MERDRKGKTTEDELESDRWRDGEKDTETETDTGKETKTEDTQRPQPSGFLPP